VNRCTHASILSVAAVPGQDTFFLSPATLLVKVSYQLFDARIPSRKDRLEQHRALQNFVHLEPSFINTSWAPRPPDMLTSSWSTWCQFGMLSSRTPTSTNTRKLGVQLGTASYTPS
jgi:hypothetical protein